MLKMNLTNAQSTQQSLQMTKCRLQKEKLQAGRSSKTGREHERGGEKKSCSGRAMSVTRHGSAATERKLLGTAENAELWAAAADSGTKQFIILQSWKIPCN